MKTRLFTFIIYGLLSVLIRADGTGEFPQRHRFGVNPGTGSYWNGVTPYANLVGSSHVWKRHPGGENWRNFRPDGYPRLGAGESAFLLVAGNDHPNGIYTLEWEGNVEASLEGRYRWQSEGGAMELLTSEPGRKTYRIRHMADFLTIVVSAPEDTAADFQQLQLWIPGTAETKPNWNPAYVEELKAFGAIRFMGLSETNNSSITDWESRSRPDGFGFRRTGAPIEWMVELANLTGTDPWFCLPHQAHDDYVRNFARIVQEQLDPELHIYMQYSNEVRNRAFSQYGYTVRKERELGLTPPEQPEELQGIWYAGKRVQEMLEIWQEEIRNPQTRLTGLITGIPRNDRSTRESEAYIQAAGDKIQAFATAPYPGLSAGRKLNRPFSEMSVDDLLDFLFEDQIKVIRPELLRVKELTERYGLRMLSYEGGQHLSAFGGGISEAEMDAFERLATEAQAHPRMAEFYRLHLNDWTRVTDGIYMHFTWFGAVEGKFAFGMKPGPFVKTEDYPKARAGMEMLQADHLPLEEINPIQDTP